MKHTPFKALSIAGFDPTAGAGLLADLRVWCHWGLYGLSVVTAVTAQNGRAVSGVWPLSRDQVRAQLEALQEIPLAVIKCGMLATREVVEEVAAFVRDRGCPLVLDPVLAASDGTPLLALEAREALLRRLFPLATVITPNLPEAALLTGRTAVSEDELERVFQELHRWGPRYVLLTGGHRPGEPVDWLSDGSRIYTYPGRRLPGPIHGSGCVLAASVAAALAHGIPLPQAVDRAHQWIQKTLRHPLDLGGVWVLSGIPGE